MRLDEAMTLLEGLTAREIREFMRARLSPSEAEAFETLIESVSRDVLLLVSARALTRLGALPQPGTGRPPD
jgi:hypothetical protein